MISDSLKISFLSELFELWEPVFRGDEWGEMVSSWIVAVCATRFCGSDDRVLTLLSWIQEELDANFTQEWYLDFGDGFMERIIRAAQDQFEEVANSHRTNSGYSSELEDFEEFLSSLPSWMKPDPNAEPLPDPEYETYLRLKRKFEDGK